MRFAGIIRTPILLTKLLDYWSICGTQIFPNDLFCYVPTDIFTVVAGFLDFDAFGLGFEELGLFPFGCEVFIVEDKVAVLIIRRINQFPKKGVI